MNAYDCEHKNCYVIYSSTKCPLCEAEEKINDLEKEIDGLKNEIEELEKYDER